MVGEHVEADEELIEQGAAFGVGGGVPDHVPVEFGEHGHDAIELVEALVGWLRFWLLLEGGESFVET